jgi:hypothetical protein
MVRLLEPFRRPVRSILLHRRSLPIAAPAAPTAPAGSARRSGALGWSEAGEFDSSPKGRWNQKRKPPSRNSITMVAAAEISNDATQPKRLEKKKSTLSRF